MDIGSTLIGIQISFLIGWIACKKFKGDLNKLLEWFDK